MAPEQFQPGAGRRARRRLRARLRALRGADRRAAVPARAPCRRRCSRTCTTRRRGASDDARRAARSSTACWPARWPRRPRTATRRPATSGAPRWPPPRAARSPRRSARWRAAPRPPRGRCASRTPDAADRASATQSPRSAAYRRRPAADRGRCWPRWPRASPSRRRAGGRPGRRAAPRRAAPVSARRRRAAGQLVRLAPTPTEDAARISRLLTSDAQRVTPSDRETRARRRSSPPTSSQFARQHDDGLQLSGLEADGGAAGPRHGPLPRELLGQPGHHRHDDLDVDPRARPPADHADHARGRTRPGCSCATRSRASPGRVPLLRRSAPAAGRCAQTRLAAGEQAVEPVVRALLDAAVRPSSRAAAERVVLGAARQRRASRPACRASRAGRRSPGGARARWR